MFNIALFGAGRIGQVHSANIDGHKETALYTVVDPYSDGASTLAEKYGAKVQTTEEALADANIHGVLIASATDTHAELIELAAKAGKLCPQSPYEEVYTKQVDITPWSMTRPVAVLIALSSVSMYVFLAQNKPNWVLSAYYVLAAASLGYVLWCIAKELGRNARVQKERIHSVSQ